MSDTHSSTQPATNPPASTPEPTPGGTPPPLLKQLGPAAVLGIIAATFPAVAGILLFYNMKSISEWFLAHGTMGVAIFVVGFIVLAGLALLPTYAQAFLAGWAFGVAKGFPAALVGFTGAALLGYFVAERLARKNVEHVIRDRPAWGAVRDALVGSGFWRTLGIVALIRLPANSPFALTNLVLSSARTSVLPYILGTVIGMAPRTLLAVFIGKTIHTTLNQDLTKETISAATPQWVWYAGIGAMVIVVLIIGQIATTALKRVTAKPAPAGV